MRFVIATVVVLTVIWVAAYLVLRPRAPRAGHRNADDESPDPSAELRRRVLSSSAAELGIQPGPGVWGILVETGYPEGVVSLVALADGSAGVCFSPGGGVIEGVGGPPIRAAALHLIELAERHVALLAPSSEFPLPAPGRVRFYLLVNTGVVSTEVAEPELGTGSHALSALFYGGHQLIARLRAASRPGPE